jgi:hypothetical protein
MTNHKILKLRPMKSVTSHSLPSHADSSIWPPLPPMQTMTMTILNTTASTSHSVPHQRCPCHTQIPLSELFNYDLTDNGLDFYWKEGLKNLEGQSKQFEQLHNEQNAVPPSGNVPPVPADTSSVI